MNLKLYDIFSALIPGFLMLVALLAFLHIPYDKDWVVPYTAMAYLFGYVINTLSSWIEPIIFKSWGGHPSINLLNGVGFGKIKFYPHIEAKDLLKTEVNKKEASDIELFEAAMRYANNQKDKERLVDFLSQYTFNRVLFCCMLIAGSLWLIEHHTEWKYYAIIIPIIIALWVRGKQRSYYYAKEVLNMYYYAHKKKVN